ncbi:MAG: response regulator [Blastocatellia bacterium]|nr:response regulator [Blastocatellia bacterium]MBL8195823.1 response regulator [Blastocatellia bacterium]MBN8725449.1 response regulator [Acidobacteriota bacterium]
MSTILIIEDDQTICELYSTVLKEHVILQATNTNDAIEAAIQHQPDLILTDLRVPDINGFFPKQNHTFEFLKNLRKADGKAKIIVCSGLCYDQQIQNSVLVAGADFSLPKNGSIKALKKAVDHALITYTTSSIS